MHCQVEQQKLLKLKEQSDCTIKKLNSEIQVKNEIFLFSLCRDLVPVLRVISRIHGCPLKGRSIRVCRGFDIFGFGLRFRIQRITQIVVHVHQRKPEWRGEIVLYYQILISMIRLKFWQSFKSHLKLLKFKRARNPMYSCT